MERQLGRGSRHPGDPLQSLRVRPVPRAHPEERPDRRRETRVRLGVEPTFLQDAVASERDLDDRLVVRTLTDQQDDRIGQSPRRVRVHAIGRARDDDPERVLVVLAGRAGRLGALQEHEVASVRVQPRQRPRDQVHQAEHAGVRLHLGDVLEAVEVAQHRPAHERLSHQRGVDEDRALFGAVRRRRPPDRPRGHRLGRRRDLLERESLHVRPIPVQPLSQVRHGRVVGEQLDRVEAVREPSGHSAAVERHEVGPGQVRPDRRKERRDVPYRGVVQSDHGAREEPLAVELDAAGVNADAHEAPAVHDDLPAAVVAVPASSAAAQQLLVDVDASFRRRRRGAAARERVRDRLREHAVAPRLQRGDVPSDVLHVAFAASVPGVIGTRGLSCSSSSCSSSLLGRLGVCRRRAGRRRLFGSALSDPLRGL